MSALILIPFAFICLFMLMCVIIAWKGAKVKVETEYKNPKRERQQMTSRCEKCNEIFTWFEDDALVKYGYSDKYILHCPHCDKLTKVTKIP